MTIADRQTLGTVISARPAMPIGMQNPDPPPADAAALRSAGGCFLRRIREAKMRRYASTWTSEKNAARSENLYQTRAVRTTPPATREAVGVPNRGCVRANRRGNNPSSAITIGSRDCPRMVTISRQALLTRAPAAMAAPSAGPPSDFAATEKYDSPHSLQWPCPARAAKVGMM